jgi:hypothetical protein
VRLPYDAEEFHTGYLGHALIGKYDMYFVVVEYGQAFRHGSGCIYFVKSSEACLECQQVIGFIIHIQNPDPGILFS